MQPFLDIEQCRPASPFFHLSDVLMGSFARPPGARMINEVSKTTRAAFIASAVAIGLVLFYAWGLSVMYGRTSGWLIDHSGQPRANEFMGVRAAGELVLQGHAIDAYDWQRHQAQMVEIAGRSGMPYFQFPYPPTYFFVAAALAVLPYLPSAMLWLVVTFALYAGATARISGIRQAALWASATPAAAINTFVAHTGFWTAGIMGFALQEIPKRPAFAGALLAILSFKPQLGLLVPVALVAGGHWRVIASATAGTLALVLLSLICFGIEPWLAFPAQLSATQDALRFGDPRIAASNYSIVVSIYGCLRTIGAPDSLAMAAQAATALAMTASVFLLWRSAAPFPLQAAGLVSASMLATPYLYIYDLLHLTIALAFLVQHVGLARLGRSEITVIATAGIFIFLPLVLPLPMGFAANVLIAGLITAHAAPYLRAAIGWPVSAGPRVTS